VKTRSKKKVLRRERAIWWGRTRERYIDKNGYQHVKLPCLKMWISTLLHAIRFGMQLQVATPSITTWIFLAQKLSWSERYGSPKMAGSRVCYLVKVRTRRLPRARQSVRSSKWWQWIDLKRFRWFPKICHSCRSLHELLARAKFMFLAIWAVCACSKAWKEKVETLPTTKNGGNRLETRRSECL